MLGRPNDPEEEEFERMLEAQERLRRAARRIREILRATCRSRLNFPESAEGCSGRELSGSKDGGVREYDCAQYQVRTPKT
jgi:hypothetical protein